MGNYNYYIILSLRASGYIRCLFGYWRKTFLSEFLAIPSARRIRPLGCMRVHEPGTWKLFIARYFQQLSPKVCVFNGCLLLYAGAAA